MLVVGKLEFGAWLCSRHLLWIIQLPCSFKGELAAVGLGFRLNELSFFFFEFTAVHRPIFVVNAVKVLTDN
jgi:hypothetical protein